MLHSLRKTHAFVDVGYVLGNTSTLHARDFRLDVAPDSLVFLVDLSPNQKVRNKHSHCLDDVNELLEKIEQVEYFELDDEEWLTPLARNIIKFPTAQQFFEVSFKDHKSHRFSGRFLKPGINVVFTIDRKRGERK